MTGYWDCRFGFAEKTLKIYNKYRKRLKQNISWTFASYLQRLDSCLRFVLTRIKPSPVVRLVSSQERWGGSGNGKPLPPYSFNWSTKCADFINWSRNIWSITILYRMSPIADLTRCTCMSKDFAWNVKLPWFTPSAPERTALFQEQK